MSLPLGELADVYRSPGPWTSVYVDVRHDAEDATRAIDLRWHALRDALEADGAPGDDLTAVDDIVGAPSGVAGPVCRYLLVGRSGIVIDEVLPGPPSAPDHATYGPVPAVLPLVEHAARDVPYLVVEAGRDGARVSAFRASPGPRVVDDDVEGETLHLTKVPGGGWSQGRYQKTTEEVWRRNAENVAEDVERVRQQVDARMIVLSGDVRAREKVAAEISTEAGRLLVHVDAHTRPAGAKRTVLDDTIHERLEHMTEEEEQDALDRLAEQVGGGRAVAGLGATVDALRAAQVDALLLDLDALGDRELPALATEPWIATAPEQAESTEVVATVPAVDALLRAGAVTDARVLFVHAGRLPRPGGMAALLRWAPGPR